MKLFPDSFNVKRAEVTLLVTDFTERPEVSGSKPQQDSGVCRIFKSKLFNEPELLFHLSSLPLTIKRLILTLFIKPLSELEHLNLGYNCLQRAPTLGPSARAKLHTLILRNNELEAINGTAGLVFNAFILLLKK